MTKVYLINPLKQFGKLTFDLIIESDELGTHRINKKFSGNITESGVLAEVSSTLSRIRTELKLKDPVTVNDFKIDWPTHEGRT